MLVGMGLTLIGINPIKLLFWSAVINGLLAPPLVVIILIICNNPQVMGKHRNDWRLNTLGAITAILMSGAALALIVSWL